MYGQNEKNQPISTRGHIIDVHHITIANVSTCIIPVCGGWRRKIVALRCGVSDSSEIEVVRISDED